MNDPIKLAFIGLDTSHVEAFAKILHDETNPWHVPGARIISAFPGGSPDFALSINRVEGYTTKLREEFGVAIHDSIPSACAEADAILIESVDGRVHLEQFREVVALGRPVFIDKPFTVSGAEAREIVALAAKHRVPLASCSSLRFAEGLRSALEDDSLGSILGADFYGPMSLEPTQPGYFWYGIHTAEMLFRVLGAGVARVQCLSNETHDVLAAEWQDGRLGTLRGNRAGNSKFGGTIHREQGSQAIDVYSHPKPYYASMIEALLVFFRTGEPPIPLEETVAIIEFLEQANQLRKS